MAFEYLGVNALDYDFCRYGGSGLAFRGPEKPINGAFDVVIGGTETFGKFVEVPFPELLGTLTGTPTVNLGQMYSGAGYFSDDPALMSLCQQARATVIQLTGAQNMTNRFYRVHPRRNDRFLRPTKLLTALFSEVDFTDFHFTGHLMGVLQSLCPRRFETVANGLQEDWFKRMVSLVTDLPGPVILLWMADHAPDRFFADGGISGDLRFLNRGILDRLSEYADHLVEVVAMPEEISAGFVRMVFNPMEEPAAEQMLGPIVHQEVARQLHRVMPRS